MFTQHPARQRSRTPWNYCQLLEKITFQLISFAVLDWCWATINTSTWKLELTAKILKNSDYYSNQGVLCKHKVCFIPCFVKSVSMIFSRVFIWTSIKLIVIIKN